jgi:uncharacterized protein
MKFIIGTSDSKSIKVDAMVLSDTRALINASSGLGKSWLLRLTAENVASSIQTMIIDPEGEYPTLREKLDILIVSENGDLRADIRSARLLARRLAETGVSAVIDLYELPGKEDPWLKRRMFVAEFLGELMNLPKKLYHPMLVMVDEAHQFTQEKPSNDFMMWNGQKVYPALLSRSAIRSMMSAGRKRGIGGLLATQRISKIDKDSIADVRNYFIGGTTLDIDQQRAGDILGMSKAEAVALRDLDPGTFYAFGPAIDGKGVVMFTSGQVQTTHPKAGQRTSVVVPKASTQIAGIVEQFGDLPAIAEEEAQTLDRLKKESADLKRQLRQRPTQTKVEPRIERVEVPVIGDKELDALQTTADQLKLVGVDLSEGLASFNTTVKDLAAVLQKANGYHQQKPPIGVDFGRAKDQTVKAVVKTDQSKITSVEEITGPMQRILDAIAWMESIGIYRPQRTIIAFLVGYSSIKSKGFVNPLSSLKTSGLISYPNSKTVDFTEAGRALANPQEIPLTTSELHRVIFSKLPGPESRILQLLIDAHPYPVQRDELAAKVGYTSVKSKGFVNPMSRLRSIGLIDYPSSTEAVALPVLFLERQQHT